MYLVLKSPKIHCQFERHMIAILRKRCELRVFSMSSTVNDMSPDISNYQTRRNNGTNTKHASYWVYMTNLYILMVSSYLLTTHAGCVDILQQLY